MKTSSFIILLFTFFLAGCVSVHDGYWTHPVKDESDLVLDRLQCHEEVGVRIRRIMDSIPESDDYQQGYWETKVILEKDEWIIACLKKKGYRQIVQ